ncbi:zinc finger protein ZAT8-like [Rhododendron vialii]|uniref:zinc finger protein ZAT8-like n=1 Tax=Rhododendron vialii TaxID=182163 RepID=UPI00265FF298|nr:zinc finger protein ZAT8-like [Rhododendron vialii]
MTILKRSREQDRDVEALAMANSLMLLISRVGAAPGRVFACKTCNWEFPSFQALGSHWASHKKPRLMAADEDFLQSQTTPEKPKALECSIYELEFAIGQAAAAEREASATRGQREKSRWVMRGYRAKVFLRWWWSERRGWWRDSIGIEGFASEKRRWWKGIGEGGGGG